MSLTLSDGHQVITLNASQCASLELKLNVTQHGRDWRSIGDFLYGCGKCGESKTLAVTSVQMEFLIMLTTKGTWQECKHL